MKKKGRPRDLESIEKARSLKKKGLTYRQIAKLMDKHVPTIFRWVNKYSESEK